MPPPRIDVSFSNSTTTGDVARSIHDGWGGRRQRQQQEISMFITMLCRLAAAVVKYLIGILFERLARSRTAVAGAT